MEIEKQHFAGIVFSKGINLLHVIMGKRTIVLNAENFASVE